MLSDAAEYRFLDPGAFERGTNERACKRELQSSVRENPKAIIRTTDTTHDEGELFFFDDADDVNCRKRAE